MAGQLRLPNITGGTPAEQMNQMRSYLYQMVEQLNWALDTGISRAVTEYAVNSAVAVASGQGGAPVNTDPAETFAAIKSLIIKSVDIVNAYYEQINQRLSGLYVAESEFGAYVQETEAWINATSERVDLSFENIQIIQGGLENTNENLAAISEQADENRSDIDEMAAALEEIREYTVETNAYLRSGLLDEDENGIPIYGLEVGQRNEVNGVEVFNKFARFTANRLEFYDAGNQERPVAYISDYKLYITNAQITGSLTLGGYELDATNGLAFKWMGGTS